jgi:hypothetical protein
MQRKVRHLFLLPELWKKLQFKDTVVIRSSIMWQRLNILENIDKVALDSRTDAAD